MSNQTGPDPSVKQEITAWCAVYGIEAVITIIGNLLTVIVFAACKSLHRRTYSLLISLAVADLIVGAIATPMFIDVLAQYYLGKPMDQGIQIAQRTIEILSSYGSVVTLTAIALERLMAMLYPLRHAREARVSYLTAILISWVVAVLMASISCFRDFYLHKDAGHAVFIILMVVMIVCMLITCISYAIIAYLLQGYSQSKFSRDHPERGRRERNLAITLFIASVAFLITWLPFQVINWIYWDNPNVEMSHHYVYVAKFLHYLNSLINPIIYVFRMPEFRQGIKALCSCQENEPSETRTGRAWHIDGFNGPLDDKRVGAETNMSAVVDDGIVSVV